MPQIDLEDRLGPDTARLLRQYPSELAIGPVTARNQARCAGGQSRRGPHVGDTVAQACLDDRYRSRFIGRGLGLVRGLLVDQRDQVEIEIALAQRLQRLAL